MISRERQYLLFEFLLALILLAGVGILAYINTNKLLQANSLVEHTHIVLNQIDLAFSSIQDIEIGARGYVITGREEYLEPYQKALKEIRPQMKNLRKLTSDNPNQQKNLDSIESQIEEHLSYRGNQIKVRKTQGMKVVIESVLTGEGKKQMDDIRQSFNTMKNQETQLLDKRKQTAFHSSHNTLITLVIGGLIGFLILIFVYNHLNREIIERIKMEEALRGSEQRYRTLFESMDEGFCEIEMIYDSSGKSVDYRFIEINPTFEKHTGLLQAKGKTIREMVPNHDTHWFEIYGKVAQTGEAIRFENAATAMQRYYDVFAFRIGGDESKKVGILFKDITERKRAEEVLQKAHDELELKVEERTAELTKVNRSLKTLSECNQALVRATSEEELMRNICRIIVDFGGYRMAWVGYAQFDENQNVRPIAQYGFEDGYLESMKISWGDNEHGRGPTGTAIRTGTLCICNDMQNDSNFIPWREEALKRGYHSSIALPLIMKEVAMGALTIYSAEINAFKHNELDLLIELSHDLEFGIQALRTGEQRIKVMDELEQSDERYRQAIAQADTVLYERNGKNLTYIGEGIAKLTGYPLDEYDPSKWHSMIKGFEIYGEGKDLPLKDALLKFDLGQITRWRADYHIVTKNGAMKWISDSALAVFDNENKMPNIIGILQDITERKQTEELLRQSDERYRKVIEQADAVPYYRDYQLRKITFYTPGIQRITGYSPEELTLDVWDQMSQEVIMRGRYEGQSNKTALMEVRSGKEKEWKADYRIITRTGETRWLADSSIQMFDEKGNPIGSLGILQDITERHQIEEKISKLNEELEQRVHERTAELETTNKELESFSYSVSHDLRAPLRSIDGFSLALLEDYSEKLEETGKNYIQRVRGAAQRMALLIDDLLNLSRVTRSEMHLEKVNLTELSHTVIHDLQKGDPARKVEVIIADNLFAECDFRLLHTVLENLLGNAWKFTGKQTNPTLEFNTMGTQDGKQVFFVKDNGAGFDMEYANKLFGAFQRLHSSTEFPGTGVGLATVQRIIHRHKGTIWATSEVGKGAIFYFTL